MTSIEQALKQGLQLHQAGNFAQAEAIYRQVLQADPGQAEAWNLLGIVAWQTGRAEMAVDYLAKAIMLNPTDAGYHCNQGVAFQALGRFAEAEASFLRSLQLRPESAEVQHNLGTVYRAQGKLDDAAACFRRAIELQPNFADSHHHLGMIHAARLQVAEAARCYEKAIQLKPNFKEAYHNLGAALVQLRRLDEAAESYRRAIEMDPDLVSAHFGRSLALLLAGRFEEGWQEYEWRWKLPGNPMPDLGKPLWDGSPPVGRTLLVHAEQGLGDTFQFIRYAAVLKECGARVIAQVPNAVVRLLSSCPGIDQVIGKKDPLPPFDMHVPLLSVGRLVGTTMETIPAQVPYIFPDPALVEKWKVELAATDAFRIGIAWQGDPKLIEDKQRSIPLAYFAPLARLPGVQLYSLQKGHGAEQVSVAGFPLIDLAPRLDETTAPFMDTAAVMKNLDLVISADTAIAHLAGALGVPVWVALSFYPYDWRWHLNRDDSPWYPTARVFRQNELDNWTEVFERICRELTRILPPHWASLVTIPVAPGELIDRITILEIKNERIADAAKRANVQTELKLLTAARDRSIPASAELSALTAELRRINESIWDIEDAIRLCERDQDFGPRFIELARSVYRNNDRRAALKRQINEQLGSRLQEEKSYQEYER